MQWYYAKEDQQYGPISQSEMRGLLDAGAVQPSDMVWREGLKDWTPAADVSEFGLVYKAPISPPLAPSIASDSMANSPYAPPAYAGDLQPPLTTSGLAVVSMILSILGLLTCFVPSIGGVICGHLALREMAKPHARLRGRGMAIAGLIIGYLVVGLMVLGFLVFMLFFLIAPAQH